MTATLLGCGRGSGTGGAPAGGITWDGTNTGVTLSNGNLTATGTGSGAAMGARSTALRSSGKFYWEVALTVGASPPSDCAIGIAQSVATYAQLIGLSNLTKTAAVYTAGGDIYAGGGFQDTFSGGTWTTGVIACFAVDIAANKFWVRKNSGTWNASFAGDPAAGTGAITIQSASWAPIVGMQTPRTDVLAANFGGTSYSFTPPSGFGNWT